MATRLSASDVFVMSDARYRGTEPISEGMIGFAGAPEGKPAAFLMPSLYESDSVALDSMSISDSLGLGDAQRSRHKRSKLAEVML